MRKLYICIGVKGSGVTSYAQSHLKDGTESIAVPNIQAIKEFVEDIHSINPTLEVTYFKTIHGYAVVAEHSFDTRELLENWTECENKKDGMLLIDWKVK